MPSEISRVTTMRRITDPNGSGAYVDVTVIDQIAFYDYKIDQAWEQAYTINNTSNNPQRRTRVQSVRQSSLEVLRTLQWGTRENKVLRAQETAFNWLGDAQEPPVHLKTHDVTIANPTNPSWTLTVRRIDRFAEVDYKSQAQVSVWTLIWPDDDETKPIRM